MGRGFARGVGCSGSHHPCRNGAIGLGYQLIETTDPQAFQTALNAAAACPECQAEYRKWGSGAAAPMLSHFTVTPDASVLPLFHYAAILEHRHLIT